MHRPLFIALVASLALSITARADDAPKPPEGLPAGVIKVWGKYEKQVQKNRETYDKANEKVLASFQQELKKMKAPVKVDDLVRQFQQEAIVKLDANARPPVPPLPDQDIAVFKGHRYKLFIEELSWEDAKKRCEDLGGHLLVIEDNNEHEFIRKAMGDFAAANPHLPKMWHAWLGMTYDKERKKWFSLNGKPQTFSSWELKRENDERAAMRQTNGNWFSIPDGMKHYVICEWDE